MANSVIGALRVMLGLDTAEFEAGATSAARSATRLQRSIEQTGERMSRVGQGLTLALTAPLAAFGTTAVQAAMESADAAAQVQAALASMGNAAGRTQEQLEALASSQMRQSLYDDDEILRKVTANLLTFGNIAGAQFDRAQQAALDLSARLDQDLQTSTMMLGRALNDPVRGLTALTRAGVSFSEQQRDQVKAMVAAGDTVGAQTLLLAELERQFGGAARAAREANPMAAMQQSFADFQEQVGARLLPLLPRITDAIIGVLDAFGRLSPKMQTFVVGAGLVAAAVGPVLIGLGGLISVTAGLTGPLLALVGSGGLLAGAGAAFGTLLAPVMAVAAPLAAVAAVGALIYANWDKISPVLERVADAFQQAIGAPLQDLIATITPTLQAMWDGPLGEAPAAARTALAQLWQAFADFMGTPLVLLLNTAAEVAVRAFGLIGGAVRQLNGLLNADWRSAWDGARRVVEAFVPGVVGTVEQLVNLVQAAFRRLAPVFDWVVTQTERVERAFFAMADAVVFNSWVPDMVDLIARHFGRLRSEMVDPALAATQQTENAFASMAGNVLGSLQGLASAIKGGGFFDILGAGAGLLQRVLPGLLGSGGGFAGGDAAWAAASMPPGFANGGALRLGGLPGVDRNLLSLNGSPIARVSRGEVAQVIPANDRGLGGGALAVTVTMDPSTATLGAFVRDQAGRVVAQAVPQVISAAADEGVNRMNQMNSRRLA